MSAKINESGEENKEILEGKEKIKIFFCYLNCRFRQLCNRRQIIIIVYLSKFIA